MECFGVLLLGLVIVFSFVAAKPIWRKWVEGKVVNIAESLDGFEHS